MARKLVKPTAIRIAVEDEGVREVELPGVEFVTLRLPMKAGYGPNVVQKYVRVIPSVGCTEDELRQLVARCMQSGARAVKVLAIPREHVLTADTIKYVTDSVDELSGNRFHTVMDVVNELVDQSMIAPRLKEQLREYCQGILEEHSDASDEN